MTPPAVRPPLTVLHLEDTAEDAFLVLMLNAELA